MLDTLSTDGGRKRTALHYAAWYGRRAVVQELLDANSTVEMLDGQGMAPIHLAARNGHIEALKMFFRPSLGTGSINAKDSEGRTALYHAYAHGRNAVVAALIEAGADTEGLDSIALSDASSDSEEAEALHAPGVPTAIPGNEPQEAPRGKNYFAKLFCGDGWERPFF